MKPKVVNHVAMETQGSLVWCGASHSGGCGVFRMTIPDGSHQCVLDCSASTAEGAAAAPPLSFVWNRRKTFIAVACEETVVIAEWRSEDNQSSTCVQTIVHAAPIRHLMFDCPNDLAEGIFCASESGDIWFSSTQRTRVEGEEAHTDKSQPLHISPTFDSPIVGFAAAESTNSDRHSCVVVSRDHGIASVTVEPMQRLEQDGTEEVEHAERSVEYRLKWGSATPLGADVTSITACSAGPYQTHLLVTSEAVLMLKCLVGDDGTVTAVVRTVPMRSMSDRGDAFQAALWNPWSTEVGTCVVGLWTHDRCLSVHLACFDEDGTVRENQLLGELSPFVDGDSLDEVVWCGALGHAKSVTVVRRLSGFVGLDALREKELGLTLAKEDQANTDELDVMPPRQTSEDTVVVGEEPAEDTNGNTSQIEKTTAVNDEELLIVPREPEGTTDDGQLMEPTPQHAPPTEHASREGPCPPEHSADSTHITVAEEHQTPQQQATASKPAPEEPIRIRRRAGTPPLPDVAKKPAVPRLAEKLRQERRIAAATGNPSDSQVKADRPKGKGAKGPLQRVDDATATETIDGHSFGNTGTESRASLPPRGPGVDTALDTSDLSEYRGAMHVYILTKLLGEGWETPVVFLPMDPQFKLSELRRKLEDIHGRRLSITFATPAGKLIELRASTMSIFQSYDDDSKQIYCRGLFPKIHELQEHNTRAQSALDGSCRMSASGVAAGRVLTPPPDISAIKAVGDTTGSSHLLSDSVSLRPVRKLTKEEQQLMGKRLHDASLELSRTKLETLEKKFWPTEAHPTRMTTSTAKGMIDRLYRQSNEVKAKKLLALQKSVDIETFGAKPFPQLTEEERKQVAEKFYDMGVKQVRKLEELAERRAHPRAVCPKLQSPEEWAAWQASMARPTGVRFKIKNPYTDPS